MALSLVAQFKIAKIISIFIFAILAIIIYQIVSQITRGETGWEFGFAFLSFLLIGPVIGYICIGILTGKLWDEDTGFLRNSWKAEKKDTHPIFYENLLKRNPIRSEVSASSEIIEVSPKYRIIPTLCKVCENEIKFGKYCKSCRQDKIEGHLRSKNEFTCILCKKKFSNYAKFEIHFKAIHGDPYVCVAGEMETVEMYADEGMNEETSK